MKQRYTGLLILIVVLLAAGGYSLYQQRAPKEPQVITGYLGGEKINLFEDPEFKRIMKEKYNVTVDYKRMGSLDMVSTDSKGMNYLFPSSRTALELYTKIQGKSPTAETIFNTPMVIYSHKPIADAFVKSGLATLDNGVYYVDSLKLIEAMEKGTKWSDVGVSEVWGNITVQTTNPTKSNSGNMFAGLVANMLNGGSPVTLATVDTVNPKLKALVDRVGYMENSSSVLFDSFIYEGMGSKPMIIGYESQILEFALANPEAWKTLNGNIVIMYPVPTVWSSHVYIGLDENGKNIIPALKDADIQNLAWNKHGFRTGIAGVNQDTSIFGVSGVAPNVTSIMNMPEINTMQKILDYLNQ